MTSRFFMFGSAVAALVLGASLVLAGPPGPGGGMRDGMRGPHPLGPLGPALHELGLTEEQKAKVTALLEAARPTFEALHEKLEASHEAFLAAHPPTTFDEEAIRAQAASDASLHADQAVAEARLRFDVFSLLTTEQKAELERLRTEQKTRRSAPGEGYRASRVH